MEKPEIFKPNMNFINNNKKSFYSGLDEFENFERSTSPEEIINDLTKEGYMFSKKVTIVTKDKTYNTKIIGKFGNKIVTMDNDSININDILTIKK